MLNAVRAPLVCADLAEYFSALIEQLVNDSIFGRLFEVLKGMLNDEGSCFVTCKRSPLAF
jgi:hypothetical protein